MAETKGRLQIYGKPDSRPRSRARPTVMRRLEAFHRNLVRGAVRFPGLSQLYALSVER
jgi:hypothetical protein